MKAATLRVARPTNDLAAVRRFYVDGLGLDVLGGFVALLASLTSPGPHASRAPLRGSAVGMVGSRTTTGSTA